MFEVPKTEVRWVLAVSLSILGSNLPTVATSAEKKINWTLQVDGRYTGEGAGGGGGATQQSFMRGGSAPRLKPLPFYVPFLREKVPLSYTFRKKFYLFHIPTE